MNRRQNKISFIPQKPIIKSINNRARPISLLLTISSVLFGVALLAYSGLYLYNNSLTKTLVLKNKELDEEKKQVDPSGVIERALDFENKTTGAQKLLSVHIAPSRIFDFLEEAILKSIMLDTLKFGIGIGEDEVENKTGYLVSVNGTASSYSSLAAQTDVLRKEISGGKNILNGFSVSSVALDSQGNLKFKLNISFLPQYLYYKGTLAVADTFNISSPNSDFDSTEDIDINIDSAIDTEVVTEENSEIVIEDSFSGDLIDLESTEESDVQNLLDIINQANN